MFCPLYTNIHSPLPFWPIFLPAQDHAFPKAGFSAALAAFLIKRSRFKQLNVLNKNDDAPARAEERIISSTVLIIPRRISPSPDPP